jgi:pyruvate/2-oxoglutarate dehydrogenase complex dihydrolipoamide dehydrogenase (E3) component
MILVRGDKGVVGTGTHATLPAISGLAESRPLTHIEALELDRVPEHLIILGAGYVGLELAQAMRRFGSRVTVIDRNQRLADREDEDISHALEELFQDEGIAIELGGHVSAVAGESGKQVRVRLNANVSARMLEGTHLLVATGRAPNTTGIGLDLAGVAVTVITSTWMSIFGQQRRMCGQWGIARDRLTSLIFRWTTFEWSYPTWPAATVSLPDDRSHFACLPIPN